MDTFIGLGKLERYCDWIDERFNLFEVGLAILHLVGGGMVDGGWWMGLLCGD
jgi:hypothetical protein